MRTRARGRCCLAATALGAECAQSAHFFLFLECKEDVIMKIYDITQPLFECVVFPGDPAPQKQTLMEVSKGEVCNLTAFSMCAHNGTHVDAPYHFLDEGKKLDELPLETWIGEVFVADHEGDVTEEDAKAMLARSGGAKRLLVKGKSVITSQAAKVFAQAGLLLVGNESQTVGPEDAPKEVHLILLGAGMALLEGVRLEKVPEGNYLLHAAPLNLGAVDGAPCRAVLLEMEK